MSVDRRHICLFSQIWRVVLRTFSTVANLRIASFTAKSCDVSSVIFCRNRPCIASCTSRCWHHAVGMHHGGIVVVWGRNLRTCTVSAWGCMITWLIAVALLSERYRQDGRLTDAGNPCAAPLAFGIPERSVYRYCNYNRYRIYTGRLASVTDSVRIPVVVPVGMKIYEMANMVAKGIVYDR